MQLWLTIKLFDDNTLQSLLNCSQFHKDGSLGIRLVASARVSLCCVILGEDFTLTHVKVSWFSFSFCLNVSVCAYTAGGLCLDSGLLVFIVSSLGFV